MKPSIRKIARTPHTQPRYRLARAAAILFAVALGTVGCADSNDQGFMLDSESNPAGTIESELRALPYFLRQFRPNGRYTWQRRNLASKNGQTIQAYIVHHDANEEKFPMMTRATNTIITVQKETKDIITVTEKVGSWNYNNTCNNQQCTATLNMEKADSFSTYTEVFSVGQGYNLINVSDSASARNRNQTEQQTDACRFNQTILDYANQQLGRIVGNGECWTLANEALKASGSHQANGYFLGSQIAKNSLDGAQPGDMLQMDRITSHQGWTLGAPQHTSIIKSISGSQVTVYEQNIPTGGATTVNTYDFSTIGSGEYYVFRAAPLLAEITATCETSACAADEIVDCNGNCAPASWLGDTYCDDGAYTYNGNGINLNCSEHNNDKNDCTTITHCEPKSSGISPSACDVNNCDLNLCWAW